MKKVHLVIKGPVVAALALVDHLLLEVLVLSLPLVLLVATLPFEIILVQALLVEVGVVAEVQAVHCVIPLLSVEVRGLIRC